MDPFKFLVVLTANGFLSLTRHTSLQYSGEFKRPQDGARVVVGVDDFHERPVLNEAITGSHMQFFGVRHSRIELAFTVESDSVDNQRVAVPSPDRMSHPTRFQRLGMRSVNLNHAYHTLIPALHHQRLRSERVLKIEHAFLELTRHRVRAAGTLRRELENTLDIVQTDMFSPFRNSPGLEILIDLLVQPAVVFRGLDDGIGTEAHHPEISSPRRAAD